MSIIETFYIMIKADTAGVKKGTDEAKKSTKQLNEDLRKTGDSSDKISAGFMGIAKSISAIVTAGLSVGAVVSSLKSAADHSLSIGNVSRQLDVNVEDLDAWGAAVRRNGGSAEAFTSSFKQLTTQLGGSAKVAMQALPLFAGVFKNLDVARARRYGKQLGLDEGTILFLRQGTEAVNAQIAAQKALGLVTTGNAEKTLEFNRALQDAKTSYRGVSIAIETETLPAMTKFLEKLVTGFQFLQQNKTEVIGALGGIAIAAGLIAAPIIAAMAPLTLLIAGFATLGAAATKAYDMVTEATAGQKVDASKSLSDLLFGGKEKAKFSLTPGGQSTAAASSALSENLNLPFIPTSQAANTVSNRSSSIKTGDIHIHTAATDVDGLASSVKGALQKQFEQSNAQFADGVVA